MSRSNQIPVRMKVENSRLVPASAFDQEVLNSYQNGAVLQVYFWQGRNPDLLRKFWAILSRVVETCKTPWEDKEEAADALKLALGITDVGSTVNGQMFVRPGSISFSAMDESSFRAFFEKAMALLHKITGVDPVELGREAADTGADHEHVDPVTGEITNLADETLPSAGTDDALTHAESTAEDRSPPDLGMEPADNPEAPNAAAGSTSNHEPIPERDLPVLRRFAKDVLNLAAKDNTSGETMSKVLRRWLNMDIAGLSEPGRKAARGISDTVKAIMAGDVSLKPALEFHAEGLECEVEDLREERADG